MNKGQRYFLAALSLVCGAILLGLGLDNDSVLAVAGGVLYLGIAFLLKPGEGS